MPRLYFECPTCGCVNERFVETNVDGTLLEEQRFTKYIGSISGSGINLKTGEMFSQSGEITCGEVMKVRDIGRGQL
jgi:hypothetical protein